LPEPNLDGSNNNSIGQNKKKQKPRENGGKYGYDPLFQETCRAVS
jgi:hypothetical protein